MDSLSGNFEKSVVRFTPSEQSLCFFTDTEEQSERRLLASARRYIEKASTHEEIKQFVRHRTRFQLFHVTTSLLTDSELHF